MQKLKFTDAITNKEVPAKWPDLIAIYRSKMTLFVSLTTEPWTLYPNNFEKQKVTWVLTIYNKNTTAFLDLKGYNDTTIFEKAVITL